MLGWKAIGGDLGQMLDGRPGPADDDLGEGGQERRPHHDGNQHEGVAVSIPAPEERGGDGCQRGRITREPRAVRTEVSRVKPAVRCAATAWIACKSKAGAHALIASPARTVATINSTKTASTRGV